MLALASQAVRDRPALRRRLLFVGIFGTAIFFGDGVITPAISVLGAVEGLEVAAPGAARLRRAGHAGRPDRAVHVPAPRHRARRQAVRAGDGGLVRRARGARPGRTSATTRRSCKALSPHYALRLHVRRTRRSPSSRSARSCSASPAPRRSTPTWATSASGRSALAWFGMAMPALVLNYFGQGAMLLAEPEQGRQPVLRDGADLGALSADRAGDLRRGDRLAGADHGGVLGHQAGDPARLPAAPAHRRTPPCSETGQIYVPFVNWGLFAGIVIAVVLFGSSERARRGLRHHGDDRHADHDDDDLLRRPLRLEVPVVAGASRATGFFFLVDFAFFAANIVKVFDGGWFPLADRRRHVHADDDLEAGPQADVASACATTRST